MSGEDASARTKRGESHHTLLILRVTSRRGHLRVTRRRGRAQLSSNRDEALDREVAHDRILGIYQSSRERPLGGHLFPGKPVTIFGGKSFCVTRPRFAELAT